jgi:hypothetical protein
MPRQKRKSSVLQTARERLAGLKKFRTEPDFGAALTVASYETEINGYAADENSYNEDLAALDDKQNRLDARQSGLNDLNQRIQAAVKAQFGSDSSEYELVGGTRRSERKKPTRKTSGGSGTTK